MKRGFTYRLLPPLLENLPTILSFSQSSSFVLSNSALLPRGRNSSNAACELARNYWRIALQLFVSPYIRVFLEFQTSGHGKLKGTGFRRSLNLSDTGVAKESFTLINSNQQHDSTQTFLYFARYLQVTRTRMHRVIPIVSNVVRDYNTEAG
jgi:hypothetical protein